MTMTAAAALTPLPRQRVVRDRETVHALRDDLDIYPGAVDSGGAPTWILDLDALVPPDQRCAEPTHVAFDASGARAYVAGFGTDRIAVLDVASGAATWAGTIDLVPKQFYPGGVGPRQ